MSNNPTYHNWLFRVGGANPPKRCKPISDYVPETDLEDLDDEAFLESLSPIDRAKEIRRRIEIAHEERQLRSEIDDPW